MKARRSLIALALLAVYLLMTAGTAAASLSCECLASPVRAAHLCNYGCPVSGAEPVADGMFGGGHADKVYRSLLVNEYGKAMAKNGSVGVADEVMRSILEMQEMESQGFINGQSAK